MDKACCKKKKPILDGPARPGMSMQEYVDDILLELGGSVVDIEIEDDLPKFVNIALKRVKPRIGTTRYMTLPAKDSIDLTERNVYAVLQVFRGAPKASGVLSTDTTDDSWMFSNTIVTSPDGMGILGSTVDSVIINYATENIVNQIRGRSPDIDFEFDNGILMIDTTDISCHQITIEYVPRFDTVEDVDDPFWQNFIYRMALAKAKVALGRARSKHRLTNLPYETDGMDLIQEGNQELQELEQYLSENVDTNYFID